MFKVLVIIGTRPEAIKMAPLIKRLLWDRRFDVKVCSSGQHKEMMDSVTQLFDIKVDYDLEVMAKSRNLTGVFTEIMLGLDKIYDSYVPDIAIVHGDTNTTSAGTLASYFHKIPVAHVEAGLRTGNIYSPWPEEGNRKLVSTLSEFNFAPTAQAKANLIAEAVDESRIKVTGNTVIDALLYMKEKLNNENIVSKHLLDLTKCEEKIILVTCHRRENFGSGFEDICNALIEISQNKNVKIIFPVHLNPNVQEPVNRLLQNIDNITLIEPLEYVDFVHLMLKSYIILTDSGGIQEEAPSLGKPVLVLRETTERPEALEAGTVKLVGTYVSNIVNSVNELLTDNNAYKKMSLATNPYGDGQSTDRIADMLFEHLSNQKPY